MPRITEPPATSRRWFHLHPLRPTRLDKIKNFHLDLPIGRMILKNVPAAKTLGRGRRPDTGQDRLDFLDAPSVGRGHVPGDYDRRSRH